ncbi:MAG: nucleoside hydrolase [Pirellulaceae bacterium]
MPMPRPSFFVSHLGFLLLTVIWIPAVAMADSPVRIIFDTDMESDCDDAAALAMLHALADRGEVKILGTMISAKHRWSAACTDAINTYFGRADLPIGVPKKPAGIQQGSRYAEKIAATFPHDTPPFEEVPDATSLYRRILANEADGSVTIVTVGDLTNLRYLIESEPDDHSPLSGKELVALKVAHWVCMGSRYPADLDPGRWGNFKPDPESTVKAIEGWPTLITFTGGGKFAELLATGKQLGQLPDDNPVRRAYELYFDGTARNRHSADQIAVMVAARGTGQPWKLVTEGHNHIFPNGTHEWRTEPDNPKHQFISALAEGADPQKVVAQFYELMRHLPQE